MFDFWHNLTKSAEEKQQEALHAYLDNALSPRQRRQFEQQLAQDAGLRAELAQLQRLKQNLRRLPRQPVPRNFTLNPALYGRPRRQPLVQAYPALRFATVLTAFFFILALGISLTMPDADQSFSAEVASAPEAGQIETTRLSTEEVMLTSPAAAQETLREGESAEASLEASEAEETAAEADTAAVITGYPAPAGTAIPPVEETIAAEVMSAPPAATETARPTATTSSIPRQPTEEAIVANRLATIEAGGDEAGVETELEPDTAAEISQNGDTSFNGLQVLQIILGITFVALLLLTFLARRQL